MPNIQEQTDQDERNYEADSELLANLFELAFGEDAINKGYTNAEVYAKLREFSNLALTVED